MLSAIHGQAVRNLIYVAASEADVSKLAVVHECKLFRRTAGLAPNAESSDGLIEHPCYRMWRSEAVPRSNCCKHHEPLCPRGTSDWAGECKGGASISNYLPRYDSYAPRRVSLILRGHDT